MQVLEVLADDSNFRSMAMELSAAPAAAMLMLPPEAFESAWCAGEATSSCTHTQSVMCKSAIHIHTACPAQHGWRHYDGPVRVPVCDGYRHSIICLWAHVVSASGLRRMNGLACYPPVYASRPSKPQCAQYYILPQAMAWAGARCNAAPGIQAGDDGFHVP